MQVASKVRNPPSTFGHARPLGSRIIHYVRDGRTDRLELESFINMIKLTGTFYF